MRLLILFLISLSIPSLAQLSGDAQISVITCGPGQGELYTAFGHSAFRVYDPETGYDAVYNYGAFDFHQKHFYLNFARGYLYYKLGVHDYKNFEYYYMAEDRFIHEQPLDLTQFQKQKLFNYLVNNAKPENQFYRYDYFYNNCATKIRDVVKEVFGDSVNFDGSHIKTDYTIRELTDLYLGNQPWGDLGIDICLGLPMDKKAAPIEYMFLPDYVEAGFNHASIKNGSTTRPLVTGTKVVYASQGFQVEDSIFHPLYVFNLIFLVACFISYRDWKRKSLLTIFDAVLFTVTGAIGLLLLLLWIATDHQAAARNMNLLWALPTNLVAVIAFIRQPKWLEKYFLVVFVISIVTLFTWWALPQQLHYALIPIVLTLALRSFIQFKIRKSI